METVTGLGLDRLEGHARLSQPGETGVAELVAGGPLEPGPLSGVAQHHVDAVGRHHLGPGSGLSR